MPNVLNRLVKDKRLELMPDELTRLLDAELAKPEDEMDTQLVSELLHLVEKDAPTDADRAADWQAISKKAESAALARGAAPHGHCGGLDHSGIPRHLHFRAGV